MDVGSHVKPFWPDSSDKVLPQMFMYNFEIRYVFTSVRRHFYIDNFTLITLTPGGKLQAKPVLFLPCTKYSKPQIQLTELLFE